MRAIRSLPTFQGTRLLVFHAAVSVSVLLVGTRWALNSNDRPELPLLCERPRTVAPQFDEPHVISDEQLALVLRKLHPSFQSQPTKVNYIDHGLRMWTPRATFAEGAISGKEMMSMLLDHTKFAKTWGTSVPPLLQRSANGIEVTTQEGKSSVSHEDHLLGTLAESGTPLSATVVTAQGPGRVHDLLVHALKSFRLNQQEYEWTTLATAFYTANGRGWYSREGQYLDFNRLARRLMRQEQPLGVCYGQHRIYTLTMLLRVDDQMRSEGNKDGLITSSTKVAIHDYLSQMTNRLFKSQSPLGYWDGNWPDNTLSVPDPTTDERSRRILATGHALEWWAMAPKSLHPPRETMVRAGQWLFVTIEAMNDEQIEDNYTFLTHAARALALWRGCFPDEFERRQAVARSATKQVSLAASGP